MTDAALIDAIRSVPTGAWAVGVSGGADSVALLSLLHGQMDRLQLHVVHLDHQLRTEGQDDAQFVRYLAQKWTLPVTIATREEVEPRLCDAPSNPSAHYRALRLTLFRDVVRARHLAGVILAHHADDQAETILQRLIRGSAVTALAGMSSRTEMRGLTILRPLLNVRRARLRAYLESIHQPWREDASNATDIYLRNRLRGLLREHEDWIEPLLTLSSRCAALRDWIESTAPDAPSELPTQLISDLPDVLARHVAARWLESVGVLPERIDRNVTSQLLTMARDAAAAPRQHFPGNVLVRRKGGVLSVVRSLGRGCRG